MMGRPRPWMKFYPSDWRADPGLRVCSIAARGLWLEMIALMHEAEPYGYLLVSGRAPTDDELAAVSAVSPQQLPDLIAELERAAVFSRRRDGVIFSRRMVRDEKRSKTAKKNGKNGGNPALTKGGITAQKQKEKPEWDNLEDKPPDKGCLKTQRPEARGQRLDSYTSTPSESQRSSARSSDLDELERWRLRAIEAAGGAINETSPSILVVSQIARWRDAGVSLDLDLVPFIVTRTAGKRRGQFQSWAAFGDGPIEAMERRKRPREAGQGQPQSSADRVRRWRRIAGLPIEQEDT